MIIRENQRKITQSSKFRRDIFSDDGSLKIIDVSTKRVSTKYLASDGGDINLENSIIPSTGTISIGSATNKINTIHANDINVDVISSATLTIEGSLTTRGTISLEDSIVPSLSGINLGSASNYFNALYVSGIYGAPGSLNVYSSIVPDADSSRDIGSSTTRFRSVYATDIYGNSIGASSGSIVNVKNTMQPASSNAYDIGSSANYFRNVYSASIFSDTINPNVGTTIKVASTIEPNTNAASDIGSSTLKFNDGYFNNRVYVGTEYIDAAKISNWDSSSTSISNKANIDLSNINDNGRLVIDNRAIVVEEEVTYLFEMDGTNFVQLFFDSYTDLNYIATNSATSWSTTDHGWIKFTDPSDYIQSSDVFFSDAITSFSKIMVKIDADDISQVDVSVSTDGTTFTPVTPDTVVNMTGNQLFYKLSGNTNTLDVRIYSIGIYFE